MVTKTDSEIATIVQGMITGIPVGISGILVTIVDQQVYFVEQSLDTSIGITSIADKYQPVITSFTAANVLSLMEGQGLGTQSVSIGELSINKGINQNSSASMRLYAQEQLDALKEILGEGISYYKANG